MKEKMTESGVANVPRFTKQKLNISKLFWLSLGLIWTSMAEAQTGIQGGLSAATAQVKGAYTYIGPLILAIGGVVGVAGGLRVYIKWNNGERDINKEIMGWAGSCIFLVLVGTIITAFFG